MNGARPRSHAGIGCTKVSGGTIVLVIHAAPRLSSFEIELGFSSQNATTDRLEAPHLFLVKGNWIKYVVHVVGEGQIDRTALENADAIAGAQSCPSPLPDLVAAKSARLCFYPSGQLVRPTTPTP
jgi:hypothetical protein